MKTTLITLAFALFPLLSHAENYKLDIEFVGIPTLKGSSVVRLSADITSSDIWKQNWTSPGPESTDKLTRDFTASVKPQGDKSAQISITYKERAIRGKEDVSKPFYYQTTFSNFTIGEEQAFKVPSQMFDDGFVVVSLKKVEQDAAANP